VLLRPANDGQICSLGANAADKCVGLCVRGREGCEVGKHDFAHMYGVYD